MIPPDFIDDVLNRTDIVEIIEPRVALKKSGSATIAPAHATIELIDHMRGARAGPVPVSVMLDGEYGIRDVVLGVPCHLGAGGLISVEDLGLTADEQAALTAAADAIRTRLAE